MSITGVCLSSLDAVHGTATGCQVPNDVPRRTGQVSLTKKEIRTIRARIMKAVGKRVVYKYPGGRDVRGELKDRAIVWSGPFDGAYYWDVIDLIDFPQEKHRYQIRIGYYRYRQVGDKLGFAGQTTITEPVHIMKRVFAKATNKMKDWSRQYIFARI